MTLFSNSKLVTTIFRIFNITIPDPGARTADAKVNIPVAVATTIFVISFLQISKSFPQDAYDPQFTYPISSQSFLDFLVQRAKFLSKLSGHLT